MFRNRTVLATFAIITSACSGVTSTTIPGSAQPGIDEASVVSVDRQPDGEIATVTRVLDGDSFEATIAGEPVEVRLVNVNAPERDECYGDRSRTALDELIGGAEILLEGNGQDSTDRFGRLLRRAFRGDVDVNATMALRGNVVSLGPDLAAYETRAWDARVGMWEPSACGAIPEDVIIAEFEYDPPGPDDQRAADEWVLIENRSPAAVALGGWILRDESTQHRFTFPDDTTIGPGETIRVRSGCGADSADNLYWCARDPVWSNSGDTIILQNPVGNVADRVLYTG